MKNTSGQGRAATVPAGIDQWNWGAFLLNWIWGLGNNTFIALLMFVPFVNLVMAFILGAKGSSWSWQNKRWDSIEQFRAAQRKWAMAGVALLVASIAAAVALSFAISASFKASEPFKQSFARLNASREALEWLGKPMTAGFPMGSIQVSGAHGTASLSYSVQGPGGKGTAYVQATQDMGRWQVDRMTLEDPSGRRMEIAQ